jgi:hypothetical protein
MRLRSEREGVILPRSRSSSWPSVTFSLLAASKGENPARLRAHSRISGLISIRSVTTPDDRQEAFASALCVRFGSIAMSRCIRNS